MFLRPRYSLLTLLLLTAIIAGGVKLWRGPHRVRLDPTSSADQEEYRDMLMFLKGNTRTNRTPDELSVVYRRGWGWKKEIDCFVYTFQRPVYLITGRYYGDPEKRHQFFLRSETVPTNEEILRAAKREVYQDDFKLEQVDSVLFWIYAMPRNGPVVFAGDSSTNNKEGEVVGLPIARDLYLGTAEGKIYRRMRGPAHLALMYEASYVPHELDAVEPPELQAHLTEEFARHQILSPSTR